MASDPLIGQNLDEYRLLSLLGKGGMARVYLGLDVRLKRYVSIKVIDTPFRTDPSYVRRFQLEAQAVAQLEHPNIVRLYRYGETRSLLYMAMQYVEGADLDSMLESYRRNGDYIPSQDASRIIRELCQALDYAHGRGVIHRDVKPSNVILDRQGHPYLTDFGLALFAEPETREQVFGTPHYMSPEQIKGAGATPLSDLYAVGVMLYQMFTGELPFDAPDPMNVAQLQVNQEPRPPRDVRPEISPEVQSVIMKAMSKVPEKRYPTGEALSAALEHALTVTPAGVMAPLPTLPYLSIPDRVTVELTRNPPPALGTLENGLGSAEIPRREAPLPRRVAAPVPSRPQALSARPRPTASRREPLAVPRRRRRGAVFGRALGCLVALLVLVALVAGAYWVVTESSRLLSNFNWSWMPKVPRELPTVSFPKLTLPTLPTGLPLIPGLPTAATQPTATLTLEPTALPAEPPPPQTYRINIIGQGGDGLVVVNKGTQPFPLAPLQLGDGNGAISGGEWGVDSLQPNGCVMAIKSGPHPKPAEVACNPATNTTIVRRKPDVFWEKNFNVYYNNQMVGVCTETRCQIQITVQ